MLNISQITYQYEKESFCFDFVAQRGEITAVLGKSGAGKSTLLSLIAGFLRPTSGDILVDNVSILAQEIYERDISILFQQNNLFEHLNIFENIALGINPKLKLTPLQSDKLKKLAIAFEIDHLLAKLPSQISGGQKQRASLCRTMLRKKSILLLDEPFSALDKSLKDELLINVANMTKNENICTIMVTHFKEDALKVASKIITIENGQTVREDRK